MLVWVLSSVRFSLRTCLPKSQGKGRRGKRGPLPEGVSKHPRKTFIATKKGQQKKGPSCLTHTTQPNTHGPRIPERERGRGKTKVGGREGKRGGEERGGQEQIVTRISMVAKKEEQTHTHTHTALGSLGFFFFLGRGPKRNRRRRRDFSASFRLLWGEERSRRRNESARKRENRRKSGELWDR